LIPVQGAFVFQISSLLTERAQAKHYKTLLEGLEHEKKQLETKVGEMQKTVAQSQVNANSDGKSKSIRRSKYSICLPQIVDQNNLKVLVMFGTTLIFNFFITQT
jgi:hypothetical protein